MLLVAVKAVTIQPTMPQLVVLAAAAGLQIVLQVVRLVTLVVTLLLKDTLAVATLEIRVLHILLVLVVDQVQQAKVLLAHQLLAMVVLER
jgi:hypothetical protein